ncbi:MAG TPA: DUF1343 domain-containing protein [Candidatus Binatia bacterium]|nr:DUF1343 domain-containing protein [Candidatus Binatia bacterium]
MKLGIDRLLGDAVLRRELAGRRPALLAHPASMTADFRHAVDALSACPETRPRAAFGPQHGMRGEMQDNMQETADYVDPVHGIPVFSLYGEVRRPTAAMLDTFDVLLVDVQDVGTRIYTFLTTVLYVLEAGARAGKAVWVLDRPNPAGRPVEGVLLQPGWESFVGAGALPMRHGLTLGEAAQWFRTHHRLDVDLRVVAMEDYDPTTAPGYGWPLGELSWVNPSPNAATLSMARAYPGTVLLEGTNLSEGRGTTRPLEVVGAPDLDITRLLDLMATMAPAWMAGCRLRPCHFQPTFHKFAGELCAGIQIHVDDAAYRHDAFRPYRLVALFLKALRAWRPDWPIWRDFPYEYETRLAIDVINGGPSLREWVDDAGATASDFDALLVPDERAWVERRRQALLYPA